MRNYMMKETTENKSSSADSRLVYSAPTWELFTMPRGLALLEIVSLEGDIEDYTDGDDF